MEGLLAGGGLTKLGKLRSHLWKHGGAFRQAACQDREQESRYPIMRRWRWLARRVYL
jgi:hypothetical protein